MDLFWTSLRFTSLLVEAQTVIGYRVLGLSGIWSIPDREKRRMIEEKPPAFMEAAFAANIAAMSGSAPHKVMEAAMEPLEKTARSNRKRLAKRGLKR